MTKKLYRSRENRSLTGLLGGLGEFLDIDPTVFRLFYIVITVFTGFIPAIMAYIIGTMVVPLRPKKIVVEVEKEETAKI